MRCGPFKAPDSSIACSFALLCDGIYFVRREMAYRRPETQKSTIFTLGVKNERIKTNELDQTKMAGPTYAQ
jgi:hypothetical protein